MLSWQSFMCTAFTIYVTFYFTVYRNKWGFLEIFQNCRGAKLDCIPEVCNEWFETLISNSQRDWSLPELFQTNNSMTDKLEVLICSSSFLHWNRLLRSRERNMERIKSEALNLVLIYVRAWDQYSLGNWQLSRWDFKRCPGSTKSLQF